jgi:large subunit ribosomal protein L21
VYAIVRSGGKQYRVQAGDTVYLERLDVPVGETISLDEVLLVGGEDTPQAGAPRVASARVVGTVVEHGRHAKIRVFKYKKRKHYRRTRGHRQAFTAVKVDKVEV